MDQHPAGDSRVRDLKHEHEIMLRADGTGTDMLCDPDKPFNDAVRLMVGNPSLSLFDAYDSSTNRLSLDNSDWPPTEVEIDSFTAEDIQRAEVSSYYITPPRAPDVSEAPNRASTKVQRAQPANKVSTMQALTVVLVCAGLATAGSSPIKDMGFDPLYIVESDTALLDYAKSEHSDGRCQFFDDAVLFRDSLASEIIPCARFGTAPPIGVLEHTCDCPDFGSMLDLKNARNSCTQRHQFVPQQQNESYELFNVGIDLAFYLMPQIIIKEMTPPNASNAPAYEYVIKEYTDMG